MPAARMSRLQSRRRKRSCARDTTSMRTATSTVSRNMNHLTAARPWPLSCGSRLGWRPRKRLPFMTGVTSLQTNILAWLTPVAIILVMVLGGMAMANRISWGWCIGAIFGIAIAFGAPQIVAWVRGMFGVWSQRA